MKSDLRLLTEKVEKQLGLKVHLKYDLEQLMKILHKHRISLKKLSPQTLDHLALLAGYQSWKDLMEALHGEADGEINYETRDH